MRRECGLNSPSAAARHLGCLAAPGQPVALPLGLASGRLGLGRRSGHHRRRRLRSGRRTHHHGRSGGALQVSAGAPAVSPPGLPGSGQQVVQLLLRRHHGRCVGRAHHGALLWAGGRLRRGAGCARGGVHGAQLGVAPGLPSTTSTRCRLGTRRRGGSWNRLWSRRRRRRWRRRWAWGGCRGRCRSRRRCRRRTRRRNWAGFVAATSTRGLTAAMVVTSFLAGLGVLGDGQRRHDAEGHRHSGPRRLLGHWVHRSSLSRIHLKVGKRSAFTAPYSKTLATPIWSISSSECFQ